MTLMRRMRVIFENPKIMFRVLIKILCVHEISRARRGLSLAEIAFITQLWALIMGALVAGERHLRTALAR